MNGLIISDVFIPYHGISHISLKKDDIVKTLDGYGFFNFFKTFKTIEKDVEWLIKIYTIEGNCYYIHFKDKKFAEKMFNYIIENVSKTVIRINSGNIEFPIVNN